MGCGYSSSFVVHEQQPSPVALPSACSKHPLETRIVQDEVVDKCVDQPDSEETRLNVLPEGDFIDGMLGLWDERVADDLVGGLANGELFQDPDFPANTSSLSYSDPEDAFLQKIVWQRPHEISENPNLFVDGVSRSDVKQGGLGDCWLISACAALSRKPELIEKVVPPNQPLAGEGYKGVVYIRFWRFGEWVTVYIDDRLPVKKGSLLYASCTDPNEFWLAFVEKAYAKLHGSYEALVGGQAIEAFVDLTGGLAEKLEITPKIYRKLRIAFNRGAFITCARKECPPDKKDEWRITTACKDTDFNGLVKGHAYTVTDVKRVETDSLGTLQMVRIRNPWSDANEWTGAWSDSDSRWKSLDEEIKEFMGVTALDDGEFWMEFVDFQPEFQELTIATLGPDFDSDGVMDMPGQVKIMKGRWLEGINAGGSRNDLESFATNPQYLLTLTEPDDPDPENEVIPSTPSRCSVIIGLMQEHRRSEKNRELRRLPIAFYVYKTDTPSEHLSSEYFLCVPEEASSGVFINSREVLGHFEMDPGTYVIIPATFYPGSSRDFMLRVFTLKPFSLTPLGSSP